MAKKTRLDTEEDIRNADQSKITNLTFGDKLFLRIYPKGYGYFRVRFSLNNEKFDHRIGRHPDMSLKEAREKAKIYLAQKEAAQEAINSATFNEKLSKAKNNKRIIANLSFGDFDGSGKLFIGRENGKFSSFRNMDDMGEFLRNLRTTAIQGPISPELLNVLHLQLLIPSRNSDLLNAHWNQLGINLPWTTATQWSLDPGTTKENNVRSRNPKVAYLSEQAGSILSDMYKRLSPSNENGQLPIFPMLSKMQKPDRDKEITKAMQTIWPHYTINLDGIRFIFKSMAIKYSYFRSDLIDATMMHDFGDIFASDRRSYTLQRHAIVDWWAELLSWVSYGRDQFTRTKGTTGPAY